MIAQPVRKTSVDVDQLAGHLARWGRIAASMPPSYRDGVSQPMLAPGGKGIGHVLPGRGLALGVDLKSLGITRPIPHVIEKTPLARLFDFIRDESGAITSYDGIISSRSTDADDQAFAKSSLTTVANQWSSLAGVAGQPGAVSYSAIPGGAAMTNANAGALSLSLTNPTGGDKKYLLTLGWTAGQTINMGVLVDILVAAGSIDANSALAQTVNTTALTRYTGSAASGNLITFEVTTALGATPANITVTSYTDQAGNSGATTAAVALTASAIVGRLQPVAVGHFMQLASGDTGVRSVETVQLSAGMGAGSALALHIFRPLYWLPGVGANIYVERDSTTQIDGITELAQDGSAKLGCLAMYVFANATSTGVVAGFMKTTAG